MNRLTELALLFLNALAAAHSAFYYRLMPDRMAVHFGLAGAPDGWSSRSQFFGLSALFLVLNLLIFLVMPAVLTRYRVVKINVPRASYWLSEENIERFYVLFCSRMGLFGAANVVLGITVLQLVFAANLRPSKTLDNGTFLVSLIAYFVFVIIWLFTLFRRLVSEGRGS